MSELLLEISIFAIGPIIGLILVLIFKYFDDKKK